MSMVERERLVFDVALGAAISRRTGIEYQPVEIRQDESAYYAALTCGCSTCVNQAKRYGVTLPDGIDRNKLREEFIQKKIERFTV
jgi:hypothetical protein